MKSLWSSAAPVRSNNHRRVLKNQNYSEIRAHGIFALFPPNERPRERSCCSRRVGGAALWWPAEQTRSDFILPSKMAALCCRVLSQTSRRNVVISSTRLASKSEFRRRRRAGAVRPEIGAATAPGARARPLCKRRPGSIGRTHWPTKSALCRPIRLTLFFCSDGRSPGARHRHREERNAGRAGRKRCTCQFGHFCYTF